MSPHDTPGVLPHQASATHALIIAQASDLVLQACGLGSAHSSDQFSQIQQGESTPRRRGRPQKVSWTQLWSSLLLCALQGMHSFADWRRLLGWQSIGLFAPVWLTRNGLVKRLLQTGLVPLQEVWEVVNARLAHIGSQTVPATLAAFAPEIFCLDETRLDAVGRYLKPLRGLSAHDPACTALKLVGLLDLRAQRWLRLEWREAVHENCRVDMLDFLQGLSVGRLLLFDLGYFSFSFFDTLTQWKVWWVSRYRENTSYLIAHVFYRQREVLDALVWLGTGQKQARHLVRLARMGDGIGVRKYLTNVCDPQVLSLGEVAQLYARSFDTELAFRLLKEYLGMSHWWSSKQELILVQIWVVLILSHIVYALRERIAMAANCEPFEVSVPLLVELLPKLCSNSDLQLERLVREGRQLGLLRASPRLALVTQGMHLEIPAVEEHRRRAVTDLVSLMLCPRHAHQFSQQRYPAQTPATVRGHILHRTIKHLYDRYQTAQRAGLTNWIPGNVEVVEECQLAIEAARAQGLPRLSSEQQEQLQHMFHAFHAIEAQSFYPRLQAAEVSVDWLWEEAPGGPLLLQGKVDVVVIGDDVDSGIVLWDYKTTKQPDPGTEMQSYKWQMQLYAFLYRRRFGVVPQGTLLYFMGELTDRKRLTHRPARAAVAQPVNEWNDEQTLESRSRNQVAT